MSDENPAVTLYDATGKPVILVKDEAIPAGGMSVILVGGSDGTNIRLAKLLSTGELVTQSTVQSAAKGATSAAGVTSTAVDANTQALDVSIKSSVLPTDAAKESTLQSLLRGLNDREKRFEYQAVTNYLLYAGFCSQGALETDAHIVFKYTYDASGNVTRLQWRSVAWSSRATPTPVW